MKISKSKFKLEERKLDGIIILNFEFKKKCWKEKERILYEDIIIDFNNENSHSFCIKELKSSMLVATRSYKKYFGAIGFIRLKKERF